MFLVHLIFIVRQSQMYILLNLHSGANLLFIEMDGLPSNFSCWSKKCQPLKSFQLTSAADPSKSNLKLLGSVHSHLFLLITEFVVEIWRR